MKMKIKRLCLPSKSQTVISQGSLFPLSKKIGLTESQKVKLKIKKQGKTNKGLASCCTPEDSRINLFINLVKICALGIQ
jgi:hypothetical protein